MQSTVNCCPQASHVASLLQDNYVWLLKEKKSGKVAVVDPSEFKPVASAIQDRSFVSSHVFAYAWVHACNLSLTCPNQYSAFADPSESTLQQTCMLQSGTITKQTSNAIGSKCYHHMASHVQHDPFLPTPMLLFRGKTLTQAFVSLVDANHISLK